jgi:hypothetical protein
MRRHLLVFGWPSVWSGNYYKSRIAMVKHMQKCPSVKKLLAYEKEVNEGFAKTA